MTEPFSAVRAILRKRGGEPHPPGEIEALIAGFLDGRVTDYQMTAWMMAVLFRGMTREETTRLTRAMIGSGRTLPPWGEGIPVVDKHSTGGVGDKVSLVVAPLAAACGLRIPMISGRSLGHTGGTLDKLESIPGFSTDLPVDRFCAQVDRIGVCIAGASEDIVPADRRMYALRDVSGIVESPPLIVSSILSKKSAARLDGLVLDVKAGSGGFMPEERAARELARMLCEASLDLGMQVEAFVTDMSVPLGGTAGNALEVVEAIELLQGRPVPSGFRDLCLEMTRAMIRVGGGDDGESIAERVETAWHTGRGLERFAQMIEAQGGNPRVTEDCRLLPRAPMERTVASELGGWVSEIDARGVGEIVVDIGGGRRRVGDRVDPRVGIILLAGRGDRIAVGQPLAQLHLAEAGEVPQLEKRLRDCFRIGPREVPARPVLLDRFGGRSESAT